MSRSVTLFEFNSRNHRYLLLRAGLPFLGTSSKIMRC